MALVEKEKQEVERFRYKKIETMPVEKLVREANALLDPNFKPRVVPKPAVPKEEKK